MLIVIAKLYQTPLCQLLFYNLHSGFVILTYSPDVSALSQNLKIPKRYSTGFHVRNVHPLIFLSVLFFNSFAANADIVSTSGDVVELGAPPASVVQGTNEDVKPRVFLEKTLTLASSLTVDYNLPRTDDKFYSYVNGAPAPGIGIWPDITVSSYFLHFDPPGASSVWKWSGEQSITFDQRIVGVIFTEWNLSATNSVLGASVTSYPSPMGKIETGSCCDKYKISISDDQSTS